MMIGDLVLVLWPLIFLAAILVPPLMPARYDSNTKGGAQAFLFILTIMWAMPIFWVTFAGTTFADVPDFGVRLIRAYQRLGESFNGYQIWPFIGAYAGVGLVWAIFYFWVYARGLGQRYVIERDAWFTKNGIVSLDSLTDDQKKDYYVGVIDKVKAHMLFDGDFPLRPLQQKSFFTGNVLGWPISLVCYLIGDFVVDVARSIMLSIRGWIHRRWEHGMPVYLADLRYCREFEAAALCRVVVPVASTDKQSRVRQKP